MLILHVEAPNYAELAKRVHAVLGDLMPTITATVTQVKLGDALVEVEPAAKKRGPKPKDLAAPAGAPVTSASDTAPVATVPAPQAQVGNSVSAQPATPPADGAAIATQPTTSATASSNEGAGSAAAARVTAEQLRAKLQKLAAETKGGEQAGLMRVAELIGKFGYKKIKDVKEEHYAAIVDACDKELG